MRRQSPRNSPSWWRLPGEFGVPSMTTSLAKVQRKTRPVAVSWSSWPISEPASESVSGPVSGPVSGSSMPIPKRSRSQMSSSRQPAWPVPSLKSESSSL